ncbi:DedA family protein [Rhizobium sp. TH2]|uniref:YqaA family protein n=1 Tax=Rhizobium sp. TH2 TaxID=2775403 RepID=UPI002157EC93|nr:YqaA family protein [Rhizobium sp. TH2]UVC12057.1 DedA family protein [Rhizobium sp. TH2]
MADAAAYFGLFLAALAAGSILPVPSEAALVAIILTSDHPVWIAVAVATVGNVIGSMINWTLGRGIERLRGTRWFPASEASIERAGRWYHKYGRWSLLLSFVPIIGDPLTIVAGVMKESPWFFFIVVTIAKLGRYVTVAALTLGGT